MTEQIERCLYCGGDRNIVVCNDSYSRYWVKCFKCGATGPVSITKNVAARLWNAAAKLIDEKDEEIKKLNNMVKYFDEIAQSWQGYAEKIEAERDILAKVVFSNEGEQ